jgi:hypothetical protein
MTSIDWTLQFPMETVEEAEEYVITRNANGALQKSFRGAESTPLWWDFKLKDRLDWEELKPRMMWNESRVKR